MASLLQYSQLIIVKPPSMASFRFYKAQKRSFDNNPIFSSISFKNSMASSSSSSGPIISQEQIKFNYVKERNICSRLVWSVGRNPNESMRIMALIIWLQNNCYHATNLIHNMQHWPDNLINAFAREAVRCLDVMKNDEFPHFDPPGHVHIIPLIRNQTKSEVSILFFHHHRLQINQWISNLVQNFCIKAFDDIITQRLALSDPSVAGQATSSEQNLEPFKFDHGPRPMMLPSHMKNEQKFRPSPNTENSGFSDRVDPHDLSRSRPQTKTLDKDMDELLNNIPSISMNMIKENSNPDDRSIFLTFSVGYPISNDEVQDFFTRIFGDKFIERVELQAVQEGKQPLYGKMVLKFASDIETVLKGKPIAKFSIKGKDIWCQKYEPRKR